MFFSSYHFHLNFSSIRLAIHFFQTCSHFSKMHSPFQITLFPNTNKLTPYFVRGMFMDTNYFPNRVDSFFEVLHVSPQVGEGFPKCKVKLDYIIIPSPLFWECTKPMFFFFKFVMQVGWQLVLFLDRHLWFLNMWPKTIQIHEMCPFEKLWFLGCKNVHGHVYPTLYILFMHITIGTQLLEIYHVFYHVTNDVHSYYWHLPMYCIFLQIIQ